MKKIIANYNGGKEIDLTLQEEAVILAEQEQDSLPLSKRIKKHEIRISAESKLLSIHKDFDLNFIQTMRHSWPGIDKSKVRQRLRDAMVINSIMKVALKSVRQATTITEVNAVPLPVWP